MHNAVMDATLCVLGVQNQRHVLIVLQLAKEPVMGLAQETLQVLHAPLVIQPAKADATPLALLPVRGRRQEADVQVAQVIVLPVAKIHVREDVTRHVNHHAIAVVVEIARRIAHLPVAADSVRVVVLALVKVAVGAVVNHLVLIRVTEDVIQHATALVKVAAIRPVLVAAGFL